MNDHVETVLEILVCATLVAIVALVAGVSGLELNEFRDAEITAKHVAEAQDRKALRPCDITISQITISQYGPGERWFSSSSSTECVNAARDVPNHILTMPVSHFK